MERKWHVVYTRPGKEKRVSDLMTRKKIRNYLPLNKVETQESRGRRMHTEPLFPGYVFLYLNEEEQSSFYHTADIINFVHWLDKPVIIKNDEINAINYFLNEYSFTHLEKTMVKPGDEMQIIDEPLMTRKGNILEVATANVRLMLPSLGHMLVAEVKRNTAEKFTYSGGAVVKNKVA
jgi:transcription antitermination factor NusG